MKKLTFYLQLLGLICSTSHMGLVPYGKIPYSSTYLQKCSYSQEEKNQELRDAYLNKDFPAIDFWISLGADINKMTSYSTPLIMAINGGDIEIMKLYLNNKNLRINDTANGITALMFAAEHHNIEAITLLCNHDADQELMDAHGQTALYYAYDELCKGLRNLEIAGIVGGNWSRYAQESIEHPELIIKLLLKQKMRNLTDTQERLKCIENTIDAMTATYKKNLTGTLHRLLIEKTND